MKRIYFEIPKLISGGIITNYFCTSQCLHCLYRSGPNLPKTYMDPNVLKEYLQIVSKKGRPLFHIGGGEPFLRFEALKKVVSVTISSNFSIEYVETNGSWFKSIENTKKRLLELKQAGVNTILVSISPFHVNYIPFYKVLGVVQGAEEIGFNIFPWIQSFINDILKLDVKTTHSMQEFINIFGKDYLRKVATRYWIHPGGRAINFLRNIYQGKNIEEVLKEPNCKQEILNTNHFHIDLYGNYIPGLCTGFSIKLDDITGKIWDTKYRLLNTLFHKGIKSIYEFAKKEYNFVPRREMYLNKCDLCLEIREFLKEKDPQDFIELGPEEFYQ